MNYQGVNMNLSRKRGTSEMFSAARKGNKEWFDAAIASGENLASTNNHGQSVVHVVGIYGQFSLLEHLVARYPQVLHLGRCLDNGGYNAVHRCCKTVHTEERLRMLDLLLRTTGIDLETRCEGVTIMDLARQYNLTDVKTYLIWRKSHNQGLPDNVRRKNNKEVMRFLQHQLQLEESPTSFNSIMRRIPSPTYVEDLPSAKINTYLEMFTGQTEMYRHIRVMFVGKEGAGKTTLCNRLQGKPVDISLREPTNGASLYLQIFEIDLDRKTWSQIDDVSSDDIMADRMGWLMRKREKIKKKQSNRHTVHSFSAMKLFLPPTARSGLEDTTDTVSRTWSSDVTGPLSAGILDNATNSPHKMSLPDVRQLQEKHIQFADDVCRRSQMLSGENIALLSMWDMGGQEAFQANHGVFMSSHCVFILAFDTLEYMTEHDESGRIAEWIRTIGTYRSSYDKSRPRHKPPIIIVGTKMDLVNKHIPVKKDRKKQLDAIKEELCQIKEVGVIGDSDMTSDFVRFCTVDNTNESKSSYAELRDLVLEAAKYQDQWEREIPVNWLALERDLLKQRTLGKKVLTLEEIYEIDAKCESPIQNKEHILLFLEYLHRNRTIIFFRGHNQAVIDPQWLADAFRRLITDDWFIERDITLRRNMRDYQSFARLTLSLIKELLTRDESEGFHEHMHILLVFMEKFGLLVRPIDGFDCHGKIIFAKHYFVPSKLKDPPALSWIDNELRRAKFVTKTLCIIFNEVFIPRDLFDRILAGCLQMYQLKHYSTLPVEASTLLRGFGCFQIEGVWNLIVSMQWNRSAITLTLYSMTEQSIYLNIGRRLLQDVKRIIDSVLQTNCQDHMTYTEHLHCNYKLGPRDDPLPVEEVLLSKSYHECRGEKCRNKHRLRKRHLSVWMTGSWAAPTLENYIRGHSQGCAIPSAEERRSNARSRFRLLRNFFRFILRAGRSRNRRYLPIDSSEDPDRFGIPHRMPTARELGRLSELVGEWYMLMFTELGMEVQTIEQIRSECFQLSFRSQVTKMFLCWSVKFPEQTFAHVATALSKFGKSQDDILRVMERPSDIYCKVKGIELRQKTLDREPTEEDIRVFAEIVDKSYFNLCLELGLKVPEIDQIDVEYSKVKDKMLKLFKRWVKGCKGRATIRRVLLAMERCSMDVTVIGSMGLS